MSPQRRAIFFDKDGTLVWDVPYNVDLSQVRLIPSAVEAAQRLSQAGYVIVIISNQSGVARGYFSTDEVRGIQRHLSELLDSHGVRLAGFYFCPHHPDGSVPEFKVDCACRKPAPGLLRQAAQELNLDLEQSWMIGDILDDVEAGHRAGCRSILYEAGNETQWLDSPLRRPELVVADLRLAADYILDEQTQHQETIWRSVHHA